MQIGRSRWGRFVAGISGAALVATSLVPSAGATPAAEPQGTCQTNGRVYDIAFAPATATWYLAGTFTRVRPADAPAGVGEVVRNRFAACSAITGAVLPWNPDANGSGVAIDFAPDGSRVYLGGAFTTLGGAARTRLGAVDPATGALLAWNPRVAGGTVEAIAPTSDGSEVLVGGSFTSVAGAPIARLAALSAATGAARLSFAASVNGNVFLSVKALALSADEANVYAGGSFETANGQPRTGAAAAFARTTGALLPWAPDLRDSGDGVQVDEIRVHGTDVYLCGDWHVVGLAGGNERSQNNVVRVDPATGAVDVDAWWRTDGGTPGCDIVGAKVARLPNTSCLLVPGVRGEALLSALDLLGVSVSHGSACATGSLEPSHVLLGMGISEDVARTAIRFSFGPHASAADGERAARSLLLGAERLRRAR